MGVKRAGAAVHALKAAAALSAIDLCCAGPAAAGALADVRAWAVAKHREIARGKAPPARVAAAVDGVALHGQFDAPNWRYTTAAEPGTTYATFAALVAAEARRYESAQQKARGEQATRRPGRVTIERYTAMPRHALHPPMPLAAAPRAAVSRDGGLRRLAEALAADGARVGLAAPVRTMAFYHARGEGPMEMEDDLAEKFKDKAVGGVRWRATPGASAYDWARRAG
jgi:hypothetical protein